MNGQQSLVYPGAPRGLVFPGDPGIPDTLAPAAHNNFAPRVGLAFSPGPKTRIRAAYGMFYTAFEGLSARIMSANPPYGYDYDSFAPPLFATPFITAASGQDVGQRFPEPIPASGASSTNPNSKVDWAQYMPITGVPAFFHRNVTPYSQSYSVSIEHETAANILLRASYVGTQAHHLLVLISANPGKSRALPERQPSRGRHAGNRDMWSLRRERSLHHAFRSGDFGNTRPFRCELRRRHFAKDHRELQLQRARNDAAPRRACTGVSDRLHLLQVSRPIVRVLSEAVNPLNPRLSKALSAFDLRHNLVASYEWKLPFAALLHCRTAWVDGWSLSGVARVSSGLPVTLYNNNDTSLLGTIPNGINNNGIDTQNYTPGSLALNTDPRGGTSAFNAALFSLPDLGRLGTAARRFFSGPGMINADLALHKSIRLAESRAFELRVEAFNFLNHAQFFGATSVNGTYLG